MTDTKNHTSSVPDSLEGRKFTPATEQERAEAIEFAFDYRGDVTLGLTSGESIVGFLFNRHASGEPPSIEFFPQDDPSPTHRSRRLPLLVKIRQTASRGKRGRRKKSLNAVWMRLASKKMRACADSSEPWLPFPSPQSPRSRSRLHRNTIGFCLIPPIPVVDKQGGLC
jgi:hypothetical protein